MKYKSNETVLYMFIRPSEPLFIPKGKDKVVFRLPESYLPLRYQPIAAQIAEYFLDPSNEKIDIDPIDCTDLQCDMKLGRDDQFSIFIPEHSKMAGELISIFMGKKTYKEFLSAAAYCRDRINSNLFIYSLSVAILNRPDTKYVILPSMATIFPHFFIDGLTLKHVREELRSVPEFLRKSIEIEKDHTATDMDMEHRVAYFREDLGVNLHHDHWHTIYPDAISGSNGIVNKDRRGELFYYMHQQIIARYNFERFSNHLHRATSLVNWREPISEGYFSKLGTDWSSSYFPGRHSGASLKDVNRPDRQFKLQDLERHRDRIFEAIHSGEVIGADRKPIPLDEFSGIDILGNIVEACSLTPNLTFYGNLHNNGHIAIGVCHDPDYRHLERIGVMGTNLTAMRDPIFYRLHTFIDDIFQEHKNLLTPYKKEQLGYKDIKVIKVRIMNQENVPTDSFNTHWQKSEVDISDGLDYQPTGSISVRFTHLNHEPFSYKIDIANDTQKEKTGTVRIFMAPKKDERGYEFTFANQRKLMIELDKFTVELVPGINAVIRRSDESSLTIPFDQTFPIPEGMKKIDNRAGLRANYCSCGWPQHMLIPKGSKEGLSVDLFVMVSDFDGDEVVQGLGQGRCKDAATFCGLKDKKYPDARAMGYPFDRPLRPGVISFENFQEKNMYLTEMKIVFSDEKK